MSAAARLLGARSLLILARAAEVRGYYAAVQALNNSLAFWNASNRVNSSLQPIQQDLLLTPFQGFAAHYAKGKGGRKSGKHKVTLDDDEEAIDSTEDVAAGPEFNPNEFELMMQQAVEHFMQELAGVRTGRANPGLIENIIVDAHGDHLPIKACGVVTVRNPQLLAVQLFDPAHASAVVKAIRDSPLSLNPTSEGSEVLVNLPRVTKETIEKMVKLVSTEAERAHQSIRRARQKGMDTIKKAFKNASADEKKRTEKELQKLHDQYMAEVERLTKKKDAELREHIA